MQNVQNTEIQRVKDLVDLYRTKVGEESQIAKDAKYEFDSFAFEFGIEDPHTEWIKHLMVNEQLLSHFYSKVAGENTEKEILVQLLTDVYDESVFTKEEEAFLESHFKEMVNYIILTPCDESLKWLDRGDAKDILTIPVDVLELIRSRVKIATGSKIYYLCAGFAQLANLYSNCKFFCEESYHVFNKQWNAFLEEYKQHHKQEDLSDDHILSDLFNYTNMYNAWMKIALYANKIDASVIDNGTVPSDYDAVLSYIPEIPGDKTWDEYAKTLKKDYIGFTDKLISSYLNLKMGGIMALLIPSYQLYSNKLNELMAFEDILVRDGAISEIIHLPRVMCCYDDFCLVLIRKERVKNTTTLIDARFAYKESNNKRFREVFDMNAFEAMVHNNGYDVATGLRKMVRVPSLSLKKELLLPGTYVLEQPSVEDAPVPLSEICTLVKTLVKEVNCELPEDTTWVKWNDLSLLYNEALDMNKLEKANCPNNPEGWKYGNIPYKSMKLRRWEVGSVHKPSEMDCRISGYRDCKYLDGSRDAVLFSQTGKEVKFGLLRTIGKPIAIDNTISVFCPKFGFDALSLLALLRQPIVFRQIMEYKNYGLEKYMDDILVPTDKRIIYDEVCQMNREESFTNKIEDKVLAMRTDYINEVRMRKHDMGQKVFDLINTEDLMRYYVENRETESDVWLQIEEQLNHFRNTVHELSEMLDHLSQEEQFGTPELLDLNDYFFNLQHSNNVSGFILSYQLDRESIFDPQLSRMKDKDMKDMSSVKATPTVYMAKNDLQRVISNILTNAQKHGFLNPNRKDYEVNIRLEFNAEKGMYQIDFRNNGIPLPEGLNKMRYGIKGEKAGQTAGTGLGGSVVKSIVEHYKGDYDVFMDGDWTVIRVYLPIAI